MVLVHLRLTHASVVPNSAAVVPMPILAPSTYASEVLVISPALELRTHVGLLHARVRVHSSHEP
jgi:hypothetical protein